MRKIRIRQSWLTVALSCMAMVLGAGLFISNQAMAVTDIQNGIAMKSVYQGIYKCYTGGHMKNPMPLSEYKSGIGDLVDRENDKDNNYVALVSGLGYDTYINSNPPYRVEDGGLSCSQLVSGGSYWVGGSNVGLLKVAGKTAPLLNDTEAVKTFMENLGYAVTLNSTERSVCYKLPFVLNSGGSFGTSRDGITNQVCQSSDGKLTAGLKASDAEENKTPATNAANVPAQYQNIVNSTALTASFAVNDATNSVCLSINGVTRDPCTPLGDNEFNGAFLQSVVYRACDSGMTCESNFGGSTWKFEFSDSISEVNGTESSSLNDYTASFPGHTKTTAAIKAIQFLSENDSYNQITTENDLKIGDLEKRLLYQAYLATYYGVEIVCDSDRALTGVTNVGTIEWYDIDASAMKTCRYDVSSANGNKNKAVNGIDSDGFFVYGSIENVDAMLLEMGALRSDYTAEELAEMAEIANSESYNGANRNQDENGWNSLCNKSGVMMKWIVCPIISTVTNAVKELYNDAVEPMLQVDAQLFSGNNETYDGWKTFRDIANTLFIIILLVVIFSQLTGVGIDNYGIKKVLPKLIIAAILVNLSFYICVVLVDLSNLLGHGLRVVFDGLQPTSFKNVEASGAAAGAAVVGGAAGRNYGVCVGSHFESSNYREFASGSVGCADFYILLVCDVVGT